MDTTVKTVQVFQAGKLLKRFYCTRCEMMDGSILFHGVPRKVDMKPITVRYYGDVYYEVDHLAREANVVLPNEPRISILVTW